MAKAEHRARAASAPGPIVVPYNLYKNALDVVQFLVELMNDIEKREQEKLLFPRKDRLNRDQPVPPEQPS